MTSLPFHPWIVLGVQAIGLGVVIIGLVRTIRAPEFAARRAQTPAHRSNDSARYARGLTDFYRISGAVAIVAGVVLLLVSLFAA